MIKQLSVKKAYSRGLAAIASLCDGWLWRFLSIQHYLKGWSLNFSRHEVIKTQYLVALTKEMLEAANSGVLIFDNHGKIVGYNSQVLQMWGAPASLSQHASSRLIRYACQQLENYSELLAHVQGIKIKPETRFRCEIRLKDQRIFECSSVPQQAAEQIIGRVFFFVDVTLRRQAEKQLMYQATHDSLTGLPNRFMLQIHMEKAIAVAKRQERKIAVLFFDLNNFKHINDSLGHNIGDGVLKAVAKRLASYMRAEDTLARLGGDEFVLLAVNIPNSQNPLVIVERYRRKFLKPFSIAGHMLSLDCSVGISIYPFDGDNAEVLLRQADVAMYASKRDRTKPCPLPALPSRDAQTAAALPEPALAVHEFPQSIDLG